MWFDICNLKMGETASDMAALELVVRVELAPVNVPGDV